ncbi:putative lipid phosphate phosphatase 3, chloroplastic [Morella rubra]|uniref:Putative lipid phosphate phosphatase 3, chloroplastic n=1 Tax=Morella rubra TaxID=262757 RepID=A0A6A1ULM7_9ROSI|nr:putative lipid phosphate phosphatase 3, chloroplastic [Morella rubra]
MSSDGLRSKPLKTGTSGSQELTLSYLCDSSKQGHPEKEITVQYRRGIRPSASIPKYWDCIAHFAMLNHQHDWLVLLLLALIEVVLYVIFPFYRFVGKDMMTDLKYPMKDNTVPAWAVPVSSLPLG